MCTRSPVIKNKKNEDEGKTPSIVNNSLEENSLLTWCIKKENEEIEHFDQGSQENTKFN